MANLSSDGFSDFDFSEFTEEDFAKIDVAIAYEMQQDDLPEVAEVSFQSEICGLNLNTLTAQELAKFDALEDVFVSEGDFHGGGASADASFQSEIYGLNLGMIDEEELARLDAAISQNGQDMNGGPSIQIQLEEGPSDSAPPQKPTSKDSEPQHRKSPLEQFRPKKIFSVSDLVGPSWCEVQYDYGLRGRRSRPIAQRPKSFVSASGKTISREENVAKENDVRTRQGLAVHKELEREIKFEELEVEISTEETRWALRIVNMIACLRGILDGFTREMPVFGILHDEIVVGIVDEIVKLEVSPPEETDGSPKNSKRSSDKPHSTSGAKRARMDPPSPQTRIDSFFPSPKKSANEVDAESMTEKSQSNERHGYILYLKDNKTRQREYMPSDPDTQPGRLQLMLYRRLLSDLLATNPPYEFDPLWKKLGIDSSAIFPTKFLVQARLIQDSKDFQTACLDELVDSWHKLVAKANILGISPKLELVYRLRPPPDKKQKGKAVRSHNVRSRTNQEDEDIAKAIAASLRDSSANMDGVAGPSNYVEPTPESQNGFDTVETNVATVPTPDSMPDAEDVALQWALQQSSMTQTNSPDVSHLEDKVVALPPANGEGKKKTPEPEGIRRFRIIGTKEFLHDDVELDAYLDHVLQWWHGDRQPEGVPLDRSYRCRTCEYADDCEWRAQKALELSKKKHWIFA